MKRILIIVFYWSVATSVAQTNLTKPVSREIGLNLCSIEHKSNVYYSYGLGKVFTNYILDGLYFRYGKGSHCFRAGINYLQSSVEYQNGLLEGYYSYGHLMSKGASLKFGYQKLFGKKQVQPYFCMDVAYEYDRDKGIATNYGCFNSYVDRPFLVERHTIKMNPGVGLRWCLKSNLVFTLESGLGVYHSKEQDLKNGSYPYNCNGYFLSPVQQVAMGFKF